MTSAALRASCESSIVQQPRAPERYFCGLADSAKCTPITSWPASTARAAATAESTPPLIAAISFIAHWPLCRGQSQMAIQQVLHRNLLVWMFCQMKNEVMTLHLFHRVP